MVRQLYLFIMIIVSLSCFRPQANKVSVKIQIPENRVEQSKTLQRSDVRTYADECDSTSWDCTSTPALYSDVECYGVFIGGIEADFQKNYCSKADGTQKYYFGPAKAMLAKGASAVFEITPGTQRSVYLFGVKKAAGQATCDDIMSTGPGARYTRPILLGKNLNVNMTGGSTITVDIPVANTLDTTQNFDNCVFASVAPPSTVTVGGCDSPDSIDHHGQSWTPAADEVVTGKHCNINEFVVSTSNTIYLTAGEVFSVYARKISLGGTINGDGKGFAAGAGPGTPGTNAVGAFHTGAGGLGATSLSYGSYTTPTILGDMGSGSLGVPGGGAVMLTALENIVINNYSTITMKGADGTTTGGGSGGVIILKSPIIESMNNDYGYSFNLSLNVSGGNATTSLGGGAAGRVWIAGNSVSNSVYISAGGGVGDSYNSTGDYNFNGASGTVFRTPFSGAPGSLEIPYGSTLKKTVLNSYAGVSSLKISGGVFDLESGVTYPQLFINGGTVNVNANFTFNDTLNITNGSLVVSAANVSFAGVTLSGGELIATSPTATYGNLSILSGGVVTYPAERGSNPTNKLYLKATNIDIQAGGKIDLTGKGYSSTFGPGAGTTGYVGGTHAGSGGGNASATYGSNLNPLTYGSGGYGSSGDNANYGYWQQGSGGGIARIEATNQLTINGEILAGSQSMGCCISFASGAGGSIFIKASSIIGTGAIRADAGTVNSGGRGGGGRVSIYYDTKTFTGTMSADGNAAGSIYDAGTGTYSGSPSL